MKFFNTYRKKPLIRILVFVASLMALKALAQGPCSEVAFSDPRTENRLGALWSVAVKPLAQHLKPLSPNTSLAQKIHYSFSNLELQDVVFTRPSLKTSTAEGEKLEFLGDALFNLFLWDIIFTQYPEELSYKIYRSLMTNKSQARLAILLGLSEHLVIAKQKGKLWKPQHVSTKSVTKVLADVLETLVGAVYLDGGERATRDLIKFMFQTMIKNKIGSDFAQHKKPIGSNTKPAPSPTNRLESTQWSSSSPLMARLNMVHPPHYEHLKILGNLVLSMGIIDFLIEHYPVAKLGHLNTLKADFFNFIKQRLLKKNIRSQILRWYPTYQDPYNSHTAVIFLSGQYLMEGYPSVKKTLEKILYNKLRNQRVKTAKRGANNRHVKRPTDTISLLEYY